MVRTFLFISELKIQCGFLKKGVVCFDLGFKKISEAAKSRTSLGEGGLETN